MNIGISAEGKDAHDKKFLRTLIVVYAVALLLSACSSGNDTETPAGDNANDTIATVAIATARQETLPESITAYGTARPDPLLVRNITIPGNGRVAQVFVRTGQKVVEGAPLIAIETLPEDAAKYAQAKAAVEYAESAYARTGKLMEAQLATRDQLAQAKKDLTTAKSELDRLVKSGAGPGRRSLTAPSGGVVIKLAVNAGDRLQTDALVATIGTGEDMQVVLAVDTAVASRVHAGNKVRLNSPLNADIEITGHIAAVNRIVDPATGMVDVIVSTDAPSAHGWLYIGMALHAQVTVSSWSGTVIPHAALMEDNDGLYVFTVSGGIAHKLPVAIAIEDKTDVGVRTGIAAGQQVVIKGNAALEDGIAVRVKAP